ncbi:uncharacterized protein LOC142768831 [Rhipicephalus microplus]|uniref:uncharacterized protein LOC142768831 n=1 Tax=Rhipicephalus microplus TaxID=6941 RepID=UPI003F6B95E4
MDDTVWWSDVTRFQRERWYASASVPRTELYEEVAPCGYRFLVLKGFIHDFGSPLGREHGYQNGICNDVLFLSRCTPARRYGRLSMLCVTFRVQASPSCSKKYY